MKLVSESLDQLYRERQGVSPYIYMELLNEGIQFKNPKDAIKKASQLLPSLPQGKRISLLALLFMMNTGGLEGEDYKKDIEMNPIIKDLANEPNPSSEKISHAFDLMAPPVKAPPAVLQVTPDFIADLDTIKPGRFAERKMDHYNQFDEEILQAVDSLKAKGEIPNANFIKAIMLIETGMNPTKNSLGYEGFPQTKQWLVDAVNDRYGTNFDITDMYDANSAAQFIHYFTKMIEKNRHVDSLEDVIIAYNWGTKNLGKYKRGEKELPTQSKDYVKMLQAMEKHFPNT